MPRIRRVVLRLLGDQSKEGAENLIARVTQVAGLLGASAVGVYVVGYAVLAAHHRVLGLPVYTTDVSLLISEAWAFAYRGLLIVVITVIQLASVWAVQFAPWIGVALLAGALLVYAAWLRWNQIRQRLEGIKRPALALLVVLVLSSGVVHFFFNTVPLTSISGLLASTEMGLSPFFQVAAGRDLFESRWRRIQQAITGDGVTSDSIYLGRLYTCHIAIASIIISAWWIFRYRVKTVQWKSVNVAILALALFQAVFSPMYYGALLKSYRYPRVQLLVDGASPTLPELEEYYTRPQFLIAATNEQLYLYSRERSEVTVVARGNVKLMKMLVDDFLFAK